MQVRNDLQLRNNTSKTYSNVPSFGGGGGVSQPINTGYTRY